MPRKQKLYFSENLDIENGVISLPALIWKADKKYLSVFASKSAKRPKDSTPLYHAPFFNLYSNGNVCMGNVDVRIQQAASLEGFIQAWQAYFFESYFSHHIDGHIPLKENLSTLYRELISTGENFPSEKLIRNNLILKNLL